MSDEPVIDEPVIVVGAGLAGLACAVALHEAGRRVQVIEAGDGVGGRVRTDEVDGFLLDRGFQVLLTAYPEAHRQLDLDALELRAFDPGARIQDGTSSSVIADPFRSPGRILEAALSPAASPLDKLKLAQLRRRVRRVHPAALLRGDDLSTEAALRQAGFSDRVIDRFFRPLFGGIQLDPALQTSRRMFDVIFRMLADGDSAVPAHGMQEIPRQLAARLPAESVSLETPARAVDAYAVDTDDGRLAASEVVVACDGPAAAALLGLPEVGSKPVAAVYFAADDAPIDDKLVVLDARGGPVLNAAVMTNVAPSYAPPGRHLIAAALPEVTDGDVATIAREALSAWWGPTVNEWQHLQTYRIPHGQPTQLPPFSPKQRTRLAPGLLVCGDHRDTASIQGALYSGRRCAGAILRND